jgi:hypothetical protein
LHGFATGTARALGPGMRDARLFILAHLVLIAVAILGSV